MHEISKGLDLPIQTNLLQVVRNTAWPTRVAVMADDFPGMKPSMKVAEGETVRRGQVLFEDRKCPGVLHTAPGAGRVIGIHRGAKRALQSVVIDLTDRERAGEFDPEEAVRFETFTGKAPGELSREQVVALLVESGQWTALRTRPFSKSPSPSSTPQAVFVNAMDTHPMAPVPDVVIEKRRADFARGLAVVSRLTEGKTYLCIAADSEADAGVDADVEVHRFKGPHPAGTSGLHIHLLDPVHRGKTVWTIGYPDVIAIGRLFETGQLDVERILSIAGPPVAEDRLVRTRLGASTEDLAGGEDYGCEVRLISGSVLSGKKAMGENFGYVGRHDRQISVLREGRERVFLGWLTPGWDAFSTLPIYLSRLFSGRRFDFTTTTNGSERVIIPIGAFERVMPLDIEAAYLVRALAVGDVEEAEKLGALELDEEDLALCSFVCSSKSDYGPMLRRNLEIIEKEG
ncbi:MAG: Na(+)-translocating NADH-quinone reductase subunit A [Myxococcales bacterium]|nr:Na(+)-translocating NADH-quinone reductase subunit A [Myxococcales bacterium]